MAARAGGEHEAENAPAYVQRGRGERTAAAGVSSERHASVRARQAEDEASSGRQLLPKRSPCGADAGLLVGWPRADRRADGERGRRPGRAGVSALGERHGDVAGARTVGRFAL